MAHVRQDIASLRTGRASASILDPVQVEVYGSQMHVNELANISVPDPQLVVISPWDKSIIGQIEKAIASAGLNLNPVVDGEIIRIAIAPLTQEKRQEYVKMLHQKIEAGRVMMRGIRTEAKREIEDQQGGAGISEDDIAHELKELDQTFQRQIDELEKLAEHKEKELLTI